MYVCHVNSSRVVPSFAMFSRLLEAPSVLNQISSAGNFVLESFTQYLKKHHLDSPKTLPSWFYYKKRFYPQFFVEYFYKNIHNLGIKFFYQNREQAFIIHVLSNLCVSKISCQYHEIYMT